MPEAADRALISVATAYRYFASAEDLWWEASAAAINEPAIVATDNLIEAVGSDPEARLEALIRLVNFPMLDDLGDAGVAPTFANRCPPARWGVGLAEPLL